MFLNLNLYARSMETRRRFFFGEDRVLSGDTVLGICSPGSKNLCYN